MADPQYNDADVVGGFISPSASTPTNNEETVARFCAQVAQIEKVYCNRPRS